MKLHTVLFSQDDFEHESKKFKKNIQISNVVYFFFKDNECLYIGETGTTLYDRCYKHTPKHSKKEWFKEFNIVYIIELDLSIDEIARKTIEHIFILAYRPKYNKE